MLLPSVSLAAKHAIGSSDDNNIGSLCGNESGNGNVYKVLMMVVVTARSIGTP